MKRYLSIVFLMAVMGESHAGCSVSGDIDFGSYKPIHHVPSVSSSSINISCTSASLATVSLNAGSSNYLLDRTLKSGSEVIHYNLYTDGSRSMIFGDGTRGTSTRSLNLNASTGAIAIYGFIPAAQNIAPGSYMDSVVISISF